MLLRRCLLVAVLSVGFLGSGCTLCKPVVGAVTGPVILLGHGTEGWGCGGGDPRALTVALLLMAGVSAAAGLATGIASDVQVLCGAADDPCRNWWDPFATNTSACR